MTDSLPLPTGALLRPLEAGDAPALLETYRRNQEHLRPFDPARPESFLTLQGQQERVDSMLQHRQEGRMWPGVIVRDGRVLGCANLDGIIRGALCSASIGYWVDVAEVKQGLASAAVTALCRIADDELGLHRVSASTAPANHASQRVLAKNGFREFGRPRNYLHINGRWQDSLLFERILNDRPPGTR